MFVVENINHETMRDANVKKVLECIRSNKETTKKSLAYETNLSLTLINTIVNNLIERNLVVEERLGKSSGGRRPMVLKFAADTFYAAGIVVSSGRAYFGLCDLNFNIVHQESFVVPIGIDVETATQVVKENATRILDALAIPGGKICGVGVISPWLDEYEQQKLQHGDLFPGLVFEYKGQEIPLYFENVATSIALAAIKELRPDSNNVIFVSIAQAVDAQMFLNGAHYAGEYGMAGNVAHMAVVGDGRKCVCGRTGCWESYVSVTNLLKDYNALTTKKISSHVELAERLKCADDTAVKLLNNYVEQLWWGIRNIINLLDPSAIVIGGPVCDFRDELQPVINRRLKSMNVQNRVLFSPVSEGAELRGALALPIMRMFNVGKTV
ncbi:MAG: ROK family transcriptional regulator [Negativicutes bacterium]